MRGISTEHGLGASVSRPDLAFRQEYPAKSPASGPRDLYITDPLPWIRLRLSPTPTCASAAAVRHCSSHCHQGCVAPNKPSPKWEPYPIAIGPGSARANFTRTATPKSDGGGTPPRFRTRTARRSLRVSSFQGRISTAAGGFPLDVSSAATWPSGVFGPFRLQCRGGTNGVMLVQIEAPPTGPRMRSMPFENGAGKRRRSSSSPRPASARWRAPTPPS